MTFACKQGAPDTFRVAFPPGVRAARSDNGFQRTLLPDAALLIRYSPATPEWLPSGFELSNVAVLRGSPLGQPATAGGDNPVNRDVVSLAYRRGVDQLTVTMRRVTNTSDHWKDPFLVGLRSEGAGSGPALGRRQVPPRHGRTEDHARVRTTSLGPQRPTSCSPSPVTSIPPNCSGLRIR